MGRFSPRGLLKNELQKTDWCMSLGDFTVVGCFGDFASDNGELEE
jgi:hypothetical protein